MSMAAPIGAAGIAMGAFGAVAMPVLSKVNDANTKLKAAQLAYNNAVTNKQRQTALLQEKQATEGLSGAQKGMLGNWQQLSTAFGKVQQAVTPLIGTVVGVVAKLATAFLPALQTLATAGGKVLLQLLNPLLALVKSPVFAQFIAQVSEFATKAGAVLGPVLASLLKSFMQLFIQLLPPGLQLLQALGTLITALLPALTPVIVVMAKLLAGFVSFLAQKNLLIPFLGALALAFLALSTASGIGAVTIAVTVLVAAIVWMVKNWSKVWAEVKSIAADAWHFIHDGWGKFLFPALYLMVTVIIWVAKNWKQIWGDLRQWIWNDFLLKIYNFFVKTLPSWWDASLAFLRLFAKANKAAFTDLKNWIWNDFLLKIYNFFVKTLPQWWDTASGFVNTRLVQPWKNLLQGTWNWIYNTFYVNIRNLFTKTLPDAFRLAVTSISNAWKAVANAVRSPVNWVIRYVINDGVIKGFDWISGKVGGPHITNVGEIPRFAVGGKVNRGTHSTADDVLARVSRDETVVSAAHSRILAPLFARLGVPGYASGGIPVKGGLPALAGGTTWPQLWAWVQSSGIPNLSLTSTISGSHANQSYHYLGEAIDVGGPDVGSTNPGSPMNRLYQWIYSHHHNSNELIHWPYGGIKDGKDVSGSFWGATTWNQHRNHVHWAMASLGGPGILGQALNLGKAGLGAVVRTIGDIIGGMGLGKWAKVGLDLAHGDVGGASRAFGDLVPHVGGTNFIAGLMRAVPVKLISTAMKFLAGKMKSFVAGQQSSGSAAGVSPAGAGELAWIKALMSSLGAPASAANIASLTHWIARETPWPPVARNNPLNTTLNAPGATIFNRVGVKNYPTAAEGVGANANTLLGGYPNIVAALRAGHGLGGGGSFSAELLKWSGGGYSSVGTGGIGGGLAMVGEYGRELIRLPHGSHVYPHSQGTVGALGTGSPAKLQIEWIGGNASDEFITWLRKNIRIRGGDVQSVLGWG